VHWCGHRVRFNEVPKIFRIKFNKIPQNFRRKIREALVQKPSKIQQESGKNPENKITGKFDTKPSQVQQGSREGSRKGSGKDYRSVWC
jgi:hypothetical protein